MLGECFKCLEQIFLSKIIYQLMENLVILSKVAEVLLDAFCQTFTAVNSFKSDALDCLKR